jgi:hypothetical protein
LYALLRGLLLRCRALAQQVKHELCARLHASLKGVLHVRDGDAHRRIVQRTPCGEVLRPGANQILNDPVVSIFTPAQNILGRRHDVLIGRHRALIQGERRAKPDKIHLSISFRA